MANKITSSVTEALDEIERAHLMRELDALLAFGKACERLEPLKRGETIVVKLPNRWKV